MTRGICTQKIRFFRQSILHIFLLATMVIVILHVQINLLIKLISMFSYSALDEECDPTVVSSKAQKKVTEDDLSPLLTSTWAEVESEPSDDDEAIYGGTGAEYLPATVRMATHESQSLTVASANESNTDAVFSEKSPHTSPSADANPDDNYQLDRASTLSDSKADCQVEHVSADDDVPQIRSTAGQGSSNPFADDYVENSAERVSPRGSAGQGSSNPFADDYVENSAERVSPRRAAALKSTNPFGEDPSFQNAPPRDTGSLTGSRKIEKRCSAPLTFPCDWPTAGPLAKRSQSLRPSSSVVSPRSSIPSALEDSPSFKGTIQLLGLGFTAKTAHSAFASQGSVEAALALLRRNLSAEPGVRVSGMSPLWNPPVVVRIGMCSALRPLPYQEDGSAVITITYTSNTC